MQKLVFFPVLLVAACVVAGAYGAIHNQISYTVSPELFHRHFFYVFDIPDGLQNRAGASLVGVYSTWWMGLVIGIPVFLLALIIPGWKAYVKHSLIAVLLVVATALVIGLSGLLAASLFLTPAMIGWVYFPPGVTDEVAYARAGTMHDFGYLGGGVGLLVAVAYLIVVRVRRGSSGRAGRAAGESGEGD